MGISHKQKQGLIQESKNQHFNLLYNKYKLLALNMFRWENLPPTIKSRNIEKALFEHGKAIIFNDQDCGLICLGANDGGKLNINGDPISFIATGFNYSKHITIDKDSAIIYNNALGQNTEKYVKQYALEMTEVKRSINANIRLQKFPYLFETNKNNKNSLKQLFGQIEDGEPAIFGNKDLNLENINVLGLNVPYVADKLNEYRYELEREILTFFGLNNSFEKKERLLVDEVNSNNDFISRNVDLMYQSRLDACKEINEKFGLNIRVIKINDEGNHIDNKNIEVK